MLRNSFQNRVGKLWDAAAKYLFVNCSLNNRGKSCKINNGYLELVICREPILWGIAAFYTIKFREYGHITKNEYSRSLVHVVSYSEIIIY